MAVNHLEDGEIGQVELAHQLASAAEAGALERPPESKPDREGDGKRCRVTDEAVRGKRRDHRQLRASNGAITYAAANVAPMKIQLPTLSSAPPVNA